ncbi:MAG: DUF1499 domain-containing protein [Gammaproteobacteria bacterium]|nr:MAG: DUF1499 domain-containing protein [Gammaproteobacteria bacterium]TLY80491.1 MAG: DUF1499 domain-containing protein [Gammaproteobacteria bacterium]
MPQTPAEQQVAARKSSVIMSTTPFPSLGPPPWPARLTRASLWVGAGGLLLILICGPAYRFGMVGVRAALLTLVAGLVILVAATLLTIIGLLVASARKVRIPRAAAVVGIIVGLAASGYLLSWIERAKSAPPIHEISTDLADPPAFVAVTALRTQSHAVNPPEYVPLVHGPGGTIIDVPQMQRLHYPDIQPLQLAAAPAAALEAAQRAALRLGWEIVAFVPAEGRLEATDTTAFFGFKDDVVVRVRASAGGARLDLRSKSRVGLSDVGTNAARARAFLKLVEGG